MLFPTVQPTTTLLQQAPRKAVAALAAAASFAIIGAVNTVSFMVNKTADLIAWAANDRREESWAPFLTAIFILALLARMLLMKLLQEQPTQQINGEFSQQQLKAMMESFTQLQAAQKPRTASPTPQTTPFQSDTDFARNLKRAGTNLFAQPASSASLSSPPSAKASTRPPSPDDALLDEAFNELKK